MDKNNKGIGTKIIAAIIVVSVVLLVDWLSICLGVKAITVLLELSFSWRVGTAVWLAIWLLRAALMQNDK